MVIKYIKDKTTLNKILICTYFATGNQWRYDKGVIDVYKL